MRKDKKKIILIMVLSLFIFTGLGLISTTIDINGISILSKKTWNIHFENLVVNLESTNIEESSVNIDSNNNKLINCNIVLDKPYDFYEFTVDVKNDGNIDAMVEDLVLKFNNQDLGISDLPSYIDYTVSYPDNTPIESNHSLKSNEKETYKIKIYFNNNITVEEFNSLPSNGFSGNLTFEINYTQSDSNNVKDRVRVTFDPNGGTVDTSSKMVTVGSTYNELPTPTREGYTFMGWNRFGNAYQEVEYIESNGNQFIETDISVNNNTLIEASLYTDETVNKNWFGGSAYTNHNFVFNSYTKNTFEYSYGYSSKWSTVSVNDDIVGKDFLIEFGHNLIKINGVSYVNLSKDLFNDNGKLHILSREGGSSSGHIAGKIYSFKIYENNKLIRNLVPCYRRNDYLAGLCDEIGGLFYSNKVTSEENFFIGNKTYVTSNTKVTKNVNHTLTAVWQKKQVIVTFDPNGGIVDTQSKMVTVGSTYNELPNPTREGYTFIGWNGKNLAKPLLNTEIVYGVEIIPQDDGSIILNGVKTGNNSGYFGVITDKFQVTNNAQYKILIGNYDDIIIKNYGLYGFGEKKLINYKNDFLSDGIQLYISEGTNLSNVRLYPQIVGDNVFTPYEPYYITSNTTVVQDENHTLKAIWEENG